MANTVDLRDTERKPLINYEFVIPANVLPQIGGVSIMHAEGSKNFFDLIGGHIEKAKSVLQKCPECAAYFTQ